MKNSINATESFPLRGNKKEASILVTGSSGFIGSRIFEMLLEKGERVVGLDNMNDYYDVRLKEYRLTELLKFPNFTFYKVILKTEKSN
ncbi:MAG: NAD-dependent epimerase/dehydratase family protein [Prolixibacteraceae bacterium]|jgi:nucleoside-diphosphate-sugar epimerase